jgi:hypothetical protein
MDVPHRAASRLTPPQFSTGSTPGMIGASIPAFTQASRKRKNVSGRKKNCVMALLAPASIFRFRNSMSACAEPASGCFSG